MTWETIKNTLISWGLNTGIKIVIALIILIVSFKLINKIARAIEKKNDKTQKLDKTITRTIVYAVKTVAKCLIVVCLIAYLGIDTSGLTALIASFGVCVGLAVNGALSNLAGGILILVTRPFKVDDYIEVAGNAGTVEEIRIVTTKIVTIDNKVVYIPNSVASSSTVINYSEKELRRVDQTFNIDYGCDYVKAEEVIKNVMAACDKTLTDPAPMVRIVSHGPSGVELVSRVWCKSADYWDVYFYMLESVKTAFEENGIKIPYQQIDVHVKNA